MMFLFSYAPINQIIINVTIDVIAAMYALTLLVLISITPGYRVHYR